MERIWVWVKGNIFLLNILNVKRPFIFLLNSILKLYLFHKSFGEKPLFSLYLVLVHCHFSIVDLPLPLLFLCVLNIFWHFNLNNSTGLWFFFFRAFIFETLGLFNHLYRYSLRKVIYKPELKWIQVYLIQPLMFMSFWLSTSRENRELAIS